MYIDYNNTITVFEYLLLYSIPKILIFLVILNYLLTILGRITIILQLIRSNLQAKPRVQKILLSKADKSLVTSICIIVLNILKGYISVKSTELDNLNKFKQPLRKLVSKSSLKNKRKILQRGGFVNTIVPIILGTISVLGSLIEK